MKQTDLNDNGHNLDLTKIFRVVLTEIFGDGVMTGKELKILKNLREVIPIEPETYKLLLSEIASDLMTEKHSLDEDADPGEIFKKCCDLATKDHKPGIQEILLLKRLALALEVPESETESIIKTLEN